VPPKDRSFHHHAFTHGGPAAPTRDKRRPAPQTLDAGIETTALFLASALSCWAALERRDPVRWALKAESRIQLRCAIASLFEDVSPFATWAAELFAWLAMAWRLRASTVGRLRLLIALRSTTRFHCRRGAGSPAGLGIERSEPSVSTGWWVGRLAEADRFNRG